MGGMTLPGRALPGIVRRSALLVVLALGVLTGLPAQSAESLLEQAETALYPKNFYMRMRITTERPDRRNTDMVFDVYYKDGVGTFIEIREPSRSRGIRFLSKEENLWLYNPRSNSRRALRLSPRDSFQGTLFSNHDIGDPRYTDDYQARRLDDETIDHPALGRVETQVIEATPTTDEAPYGRIVMWLRRPDAVPLQMEYYARSGLLFKRMYLSDIRELAGAERPAVMRMESMQLDDAFSEIRILELEERNDLSDRRFTEANLTR